MMKNTFKTLATLGLLSTMISCSYVAPNYKSQKVQFNTVSEGFKEMPAGAYELDMTHSSVHFKVKHLGLSNYTARFTDFSADLNLDSSNPPKSSMVAIIKSDSIETDFPFPAKKNFDKFLSQNESWLNSNKYPEIKFESTSIKRIGARDGVMKGNLTMLGVTKPATFNVIFNGLYKKKPHSGLAALGFSATTKIKRSEWGFGAFVPAIGDEVTIIIETEFHKK
jgi:polyisoprenoid-binding protein YceI